MNIYLLQTYYHMRNYHQTITYLVIVFAITLFARPSAHAVILFGKDNSQNQTAPDVQREDIFNAIGQSRNLSGSGSGSCVYLGGKYLLTANHVALRTHITFDGITLWARDTAFTPVQISDKDLKVIKLEEVPTGITPVTLHTTPNEVGKDVTLIGWGAGRSPSDTDGSDGWTWGFSTTEAKRWGTNKISSSGTIPSYTTFSITYTNTPVLVTTLNNTAGDDEAAVARMDSGGGIFAKFGNQWRLVGISLSGGNPSVFNNADQNFFIRISSYDTEINDAIPDTSTYSDWKLDHSLYGVDANDDADTDGDGINQLHEFAFGGDPHVNDVSILPTFELVEDSGSKYLELSVTRPIGIQGIDYKPQTTTDVTSWPVDSTGIEDDTPTPVDNLDGTETLTYRRIQAVSGADKAFIRVDISEAP